MPSRETHGRPASRRAGAYVLVLACSTLIAVVGLAGVLASGVQRGGVENQARLAEARVAAQSALEIALSTATNTPTWRAAISGGVAYAEKPTALTTCTVWAGDALDGDTTNSLLDPVELVAEGAVPGARQLVGVTISPVLAAADCLAHDVCAEGNIAFTKSYVLGEGSIHTNGNASADTSAVAANVRASGSVSGSSYLSGTRNGATKAGIPPASVVDEYAAMATPINIGSISGRTIELVVISPQSNPYGASRNSQGVYLIDCNNNDLTIRNCRILGTIVLKRAQRVRIEGSVCWETFRHDRPALLVEGPIEYYGAAVDVSEPALGINFNPAGTPYGGSADTDKTDFYPSMVTGTVFATGNVLLKTSDWTIEGHLVSRGSVTIDGSNLRVRKNYAEKLMPGFTSGTSFSISSGTWNRVTD